MLTLVWSLTFSWLAFTVQKGAVWAAGGEKSSTF